MSDFDLTIDPARLRLVREGALAVAGRPAVFQVEGPGALECVQGLLTNDLVKPGDGSLVYGALLTPKGMIVVDVWAIRAGDGLFLVAPARARESLAELLARSLPPRLARVTDLSDQFAALCTIGAGAFAALARSPLAPRPDGAGRATWTESPAGSLLLALGPEPAPFSALLLGESAAIEGAAALLETAGFLPGTREDLEAARIIVGWPALGAEIDERTLPQEVRYDDLGGVSYTKGCYTGQETVARLHFRGHTNRELRGLRWPTAAPLENRTIRYGEREVGTVRSTMVSGGSRLGLAPIRREVGPGDEVMAGGRPARVVSLPFPSLGLDQPAHRP